MLESLITSKTRIKLLLKFFLNSNTSAHLRGLETEFGESTNGIRLELNRFEKAGLLTAHNEGNRKIFSANTSHPLYADIQHLIHKHLGFDQLVEKVIQRLGQVDKVYLTGTFARGQESPVIEIVMVGEDINTEYLEKLISKVKDTISRKIIYHLMDQFEFDKLSESLGKKNLLLLWQQGN